jgi:hypothetical protein
MILPLLKANPGKPGGAKLEGLKDLRLEVSCQPDCQRIYDCLIGTIANGRKYYDISKVSFPLTRL